MKKLLLLKPESINCLKVAALTILLGSILFGCTKSSTPPAPPPPLCETNHTATVYFENRSNTNTTYDVIWDGSKWTTIAPGSKSITYTFSASQHTLVFKKTNTNIEACTPSTPTLAQCGSTYYWCTQ